MDRAVLIDRIADMIGTGVRHPLGFAGVLLMEEVRAGRKPVQPGDAAPFDFPAADWPFPQVVSIDGEEVRIVAVHAAKPGHGALSRLVNSIRAAGLRPVVVAPIGLQMPAILDRWGWRETVIGEGWERVEEWRPS